MRRSIALSAIVAALTVAAASVSPAAASPRPVRGSYGLTVEIVSVNGSGCPRGTVMASVREKMDAFVVGYSEFMAQAGGSSKPVDSRKLCQVALKLGGVPKGFTFAISRTDHYGFASLEEDATATYRTSTYFSGQPTRVEIEHALSGPYDRPWQFTDLTLPDQLVFKPCDADPNFNINSEVRVYEGSDPSKVSFLAVGEEAQPTYRLTLKTCP
ncbi:DUF4360 domain-containing protein [Actinomadura chibensis]|uniref:DUF4360 domain-containing protein n=1 Tax=Actinomadura chibensis TaxID=392828 RepID=A0A5D0N1V3_9ACTN|nr:DUF4360 domain-containing protein [Actinomadura chibensis]TYB38373.1 DUF4360 domain-containing protein [Actinomadura chibensis]